MHMMNASLYMCVQGHHVCLCAREKESCITAYVSIHMQDEGPCKYRLGRHAIIAWCMEQDISQAVLHLGGRGNLTCFNLCFNGIPTVCKNCIPSCRTFFFFQWESLQGLECYSKS